MCRRQWRKSWVWQLLRRKTTSTTAGISCFHPLLTFASSIFLIVAYESFLKYIKSTLRPATIPNVYENRFLFTVLWIRIRRISMFISLGLPDPHLNPLVTSTTRFRNLPSSRKNSKKILDFCRFVSDFLVTFLILPLFWIRIRIR